MSNAGMKMNNEEWQEKYTKMSIFYQDRLKYTELLESKDWGGSLIKVVEAKLKEKNT